MPSQKFEIMGQINDQHFIAFCEELKAYVEAHGHFPPKHTKLLHKVKYTRKKINQGVLEDWKKERFLAIADSRRLFLDDGQLPMEFHGEDADDDHGDSATELRDDGRECKQASSRIEESSCKAGERVDVAAKNQRYLID